MEQELLIPTLPPKFNGKKKAAKATAEGPPIVAPEPPAGQPDMVSDSPPDTVDPTLLRILQWKRPFESKAELEFMSWLHAEIKSRGAEFSVMGRGNVVVTVKYPDGKTASTMFSCHTDTMHSDATPPQQPLLYDATFGHIFLDKDHKDAGSCLGADDGAGVWLCLEMISAKIPGTYVFHRGEERGGIGATSMVTTHREWLEQFDAAIALDRKDTCDVIVTQGGQRCASLKFGDALAKALNDAGGFKYSVSHMGTFTDTKIYRNHIPECANISVGYDFQHCKEETLDYEHLVKLRDALVKIKWDALPIDRDPKAESAYKAPQYGGWLQEAERRHERQLIDWGKNKGSKPKIPKSEPPPVEPDLYPEDHFRDTRLDTLVAFMESEPEEAARLVLELAAQTAALRAELTFWKGAV